MDEYWLDESKLELLSEKYRCTLKTEFSATTKDLKLICIFSEDTKIQFTVNGSDDDTCKTTAEIISTNLNADTAAHLKNEMKQTIKSITAFQIEPILKVVVSFFENRLTLLSSKISSNACATSSNNTAVSAQESKMQKIYLAPTFCRHLNSSDLPKVEVRKPSKKPSMKTAQDVINRVIWDEHLEPSSFTVGYEDRFAGIIEKSFNDFDWESDISAVGPEVLAIPQHRIQYFKYYDRVVWNKGNRLDHFFGSTGSKTTIRDVINERQLHESSLKSTSDLPKVEVRKPSKKPSMKTAQDVINRVMWDEHLEPSSFTVGYEDRFAGIIEKSFNDFDWESDISAVGPEVLAIPQHRIQYFKYYDRVVWNKGNRLDHFFGSTGSKTTIRDVINERQLHESSLKSTSDLPKVEVRKPSKKPSMKTAQDVINRVIWDEHLEPSSFTVGYEDRFAGIIEKSFNDFDWESDISAVGPEVLAIPQHRIQYFKYYDRVVWNKGNRLDHFFGSTGSKATIRDVINERQLHESSLKSTSDDVAEQRNESLVSEPVASDYSEVKSSHDSNLVFSSPAKKKKRSHLTHFIGVRVNQIDVSRNVEKCVQRLTNCFRDHDDRESFLQCVVPVEKLHVTLCVCTLENDDEIHKVQKILEKMYVFDEKLKLNICGVGEFYRSVIFAKVNSKSLKSLQNRLMRALEDEHINISNDHPRYIPHLTMVKLPRSSYLFKGISGLVSSKKMKKWNFTKPSDPVVIEKIDLCRMQSVDPDNGNFYEIQASSLITVQRSPSDDEESHFGGESEQDEGQKSRGHRSSHGKRGSSKHGKPDFVFSKALTAILRHNKFGFKVDSEGYVDVDLILRHQMFRDATREKIRRIVDTNDKKRFTIKIENGVERIKANQGHSVVVEDLDLTEILDPSLYPTVVHGTFWSAWGSIKKQGLHRRKRIHIHMTTAEPSHGVHVISGMRKSCTVFVYINIAAAMQDGIKFYLSSNGVILSPGDQRGYIAPKYFANAIGLVGGKRSSLIKEVKQILASTQSSEKQFEIVDEDVNSVMEKLVDDIASLNLEDTNDENLDNVVKSVVENLIEVIDDQLQNTDK